LEEPPVPYAVAGLGGSWIQFNDRTSAGIAHQIEADGMAFSAVAGMGVDFFLADNIALNVEGKYIWCNPIRITLDGQRRNWDASSFTASLGLRIYFDERNPRPLLTSSGARKPARFYFGTQGGFTVLTEGDWVPGAKIVPKLNALGGTLNLNYTLALGSDFGEHLGVELALAHTEYSLFLDGRGTVGEYSIYSAMPMVRLRFPSGNGRWVPYLLAGAGISYGEFNDAKPNGAGLVIGAKGTHPALAVGGGVEYFLARNLSFNFEGRWRYAWDHAITIAGGPSGRGDMSEV
jgi:opacity protein-like surface antigen